MMQLTLTKVDEGEWELDLDGVVTLSMDLEGMKEMCDLLNRAVDTEEKSV